MKLPLTGKVEKAIDNAMSEALAFGHSHVTTGHLVLALLRDDDVGIATPLFGKLGVDIDTAYDKASHLMSKIVSPTGGV